jgi:hypothetical protein
MKDYNVIKHYDSIYEIENFLTDEEQKFFLDIITRSVNEDWPVLENSIWSTKMLFLLDSHTGTVNREQMFKINYNIESRLKDCFVNLQYINTVSTLQKYMPNETLDSEYVLGVHQDNVGGEDIQFGAVIYINDNYEGGEVYYPELPLEIKPQAKSLLIHRGNILHAVKHILKGDNKYILTSFIRGDSSVAVKL